MIYDLYRIILCAKKQQKNRQMPVLVLIIQTVRPGDIQIQDFL